MRGILRGTCSEASVEPTPGVREWTRPGAGWPSLHFTMKNPFRRLFPPRDTRETDEKLKDLEDRVRRVEEEWTEVYGKFRTLQMRVAKQVQRLDESSQEESRREESVGQVAPGSTLSPRLAKIQQQILERRNRVATTKEGE